MFVQYHGISVVAVIGATTVLGIFLVVVIVASTATGISVVAVVGATTVLAISLVAVIVASTVTGISIVAVVGATTVLAISLAAVVVATVCTGNSDGCRDGSEYRLVGGERQHFGPTEEDVWQTQLSSLLRERGPMLELNCGGVVCATVCRGVPGVRLGREEE